jgi:hypothetical protein
MITRPEREPAPTKGKRGQRRAARRDNRAAYAPEKRAALERWAAHVQDVVSGNPADNVVALRSAMT